MVVVIDTHADHFSGHLQYGGGATAPKATNVGELIETFATKEILELMTQASSVGKSSEPDLWLASGKEPWCDVSTSARGGWRGAILASCGPSVLSKHHFPHVSGLVKSGLFDFIVGFGGAETLPDVVSPFVVALTLKLATQGFPSVKKQDIVGNQRLDVPRLWDAFRTLLTDHCSVLDYTTIVFIFRDGEQTLQRMVSKHQESRPFGFDFQDCPNSCQGQFPLKVTTQSSKCHLTCLNCSWRSHWVSLESNWYFHELHPSAPRLFWHEFPASHSTANLFVDGSN
ncbi:hypothetical protein JOM56_012532 [Amanita muscaria]